jgi:ABC-type multidrug transport system fused ATPase/permease subunit
LVLRAVRLWELINENGGIKVEMEPDSLSGGELQLLAFARAILRKRSSSSQHCILILDDATSSLDRDTEIAIHKVLKKEFNSHTVITVAHRLETLRASDKILLLDNGKVGKLGATKEVIGTASGFLSKDDEHS